jgi:hypothetical protein
MSGMTRRDNVYEHLSKASIGREREEINKSDEACVVVMTVSTHRGVVKKSGHNMDGHSSADGRLPKKAWESDEKVT